MKCMCAQSFSYIWLFAAPWTCQVPLSMGFSRQEHWSEFLFSTPGHSPDPGTEPGFLVSPALAGKFFTTSTTWEAPNMKCNIYFNSRWWKLCGRVIPIVVCLPLATKLIKMIVNYKTIEQREINNAHSTSNCWLHLKLQSCLSSSNNSNKNKAASKN